MSGIPCGAEVYIDASYSPYSRGKLKCRRQRGHADDHVATLMVLTRGPRLRLGADLTWPDTTPPE